jgi:hypothetical protein
LAWRGSLVCAGDACGVWFLLAIGCAEKVKAEEEEEEQERRRTSHYGFSFPPRQYYGQPARSIIYRRETLFSTLSHQFHTGLPLNNFHVIFWSTWLYYINVASSHQQQLDFSMRALKQETPMESARFITSLAWILLISSTVKL